MKQIFFFMLALSAFSLPSFADSAMTAGELQKICYEPSNSSKASCRFYILGITQGLSLGLSIADSRNNRSRVCLPDDVPASKLEQVVKLNIAKLLANFPADRELDASGTVVAVLAKQYPCMDTK